MLTKPMISGLSANVFVVVAVVGQLLMPIAASAGASSSTAAGPGSNYVPLTPVRALDTRRNLGAVGPIGAGATTTLSVAGDGVPSTGVSAVAINVTVTDARAAGYVTAYPDGTTAPASSSVNFRAAQTVANMAVVAVGADGRIAIGNHSAGAIELVGDIDGYFRGDTFSPGPPGYYVPVSPTRALDTRRSIGAPGPIPPGGTITVVVAGGGVPNTGVGAVAINLTVVSPPSSGYVTAYPDLTTPPASSSLNFGAGDTVANLGFVTVGTDGVIKIANHSGGAIQLVGDISGYFAAVGAVNEADWGNGLFKAITPERHLDTRTGIGHAGPIPPGGSITLPVTGAGVPMHNVGAVALNLTVTDATSAGYISAYPAGGLAPASSSLNFLAAQTVANLALVAVPSNGNITLANHSSGYVDLVGDISGYFFTQYSSTLTVSINGSGTVTSTPSGIQCPGTCGSWYPTGSAVTLTEVPAPGVNFEGWSDCGTVVTCSTTANDATTGAYFGPEPGLAPGQSVTLATNFFGKTRICLDDLDNARVATVNGADFPPIGAVSKNVTLNRGSPDCNTFNLSYVAYNVIVTNTSGNGSHIVACVLPDLDQTRCPT